MRKIREALIQGIQENLISTQQEKRKALSVEGWSILFSISTYYRIMYLSDLLKDVSLCGGWQLSEKITPGQHAEYKCQQRVLPQMGNLCNILASYLMHSPGSKVIMGETWKICKSQRSRKTGTSQHILDRTATLLNSQQLRMPAQGQVNQQTSMERGGVHDFTLIKELWVIDDSWKGKFRFL